MKTDSARRPPSLFEPGPAAEDYTLVRDSSEPDIAALRDTLESMWLPFAEHADPTFRSDARVNFRARFWELYLFTLLRSAGLAPRGRRGGGPDLVLDAPGGQASLEAIAVTTGQGRDRVPPVVYDQVVEFPRHALLLRLTAAMDEKCTKARDYVAKGLLRADEVFVIAINGAVNEHALTDCRVPEGLRVPRIVQVLFGVGDYALNLDDDGQVASQGFQRRRSIPKLSGTEIPSMLFCSEAHAYVSGVLFGLEYARSFDISGRNLLLLHNPFARSPWPRGLLKRGVEYWVEEGKLAWTDWHRDASLTAASDGHCTSTGGHP